MAERPRPLPELLRADTFSAQQVQRVWLGLDRSRRAHARASAWLAPRRAWPALAGGCTALAVLLTLWGRASSAPQPLTHADGSALAAVEPPADAPAGAHLELSDGSALEVAPGARLSPVELSPQRVVLHLERGAARFAVRPGGPRRFVVEAGPARIEVVGTRFDVMRAAAGTTVRVQEGTVRVYGASVPGGMAQLTAGDALQVAGDEDVLPSRTPPETPPARGEASGRAQEGATTLAQSPVPDAADVPPREVAAVRSASTVTTAAERGPTAGHANADAAQDPVEQLLQRADRARLARQETAAIEALERVLAEHPTDPRAALAAFTLGRVHAQGAGRGRAGAQDAAAAFERALALGLRGALAAQARAHLCRAWLAAGVPARATSAARAYLKDDPEGPDAAQMRALIEGPKPTSEDP